MNTGQNCVCIIQEASQNRVYGMEICQMWFHCVLGWMPLMTLSGQSALTETAKLRSTCQNATQWRSTQECSRRTVLDAESIEWHESHRKKGDVEPPCRGGGSSFWWSFHFSCSAPILCVVSCGSAKKNLEEFPPEWFKRDLCMDRLFLSEALLSWNLSNAEN